MAIFPAIFPKFADELSKNLVSPPEKPPLRGSFQRISKYAMKMYNKLNIKQLPPPIFKKWV